MELSEFQKRRLQYFIKAASKNEKVWLGPGDIKVFESIISNDKYYLGYNDGVKHVVNFIKEKLNKNLDEFLEGLYKNV